MATVGSNWATNPDNTSTFAILPLAALSAALSSAGLDSVTVESGLNARQALSIIAAAVAGTTAGMATDAVTIKGAGVATTRITAAQDGADRTTTLSAPA